MAKVIKHGTKQSGVGVTTHASFAHHSAKHIAGGVHHHAKMRRQSGKGLMR